MGYIPPHALKNLNKYAYKSVDKSLMSKYILGPFWNWFITLWPLNVAPNTITFSGLMIVLFNFLTLIYYDPKFLTEKGGVDGPPNWIYFTWGIGLFLYQSFDAVDGKQARRTGMAGPLGELFDHGCDAINTTLEGILAQRALNLGQSWWTVAAIAGAHLNFYLTTWEEYHTGQLYLGVFSGPVEGIIMICVMYIITGFVGPAFWDTGILTFTGLSKIPAIRDNVPDMGINIFFMYFSLAGFAFNVISSYVNVHRARREASQNMFTAMLGLAPFLVTLALNLGWLAAPTPLASTIIYSTATDENKEMVSLTRDSTLIPFLLAWGLQFAHQVGRMILAHITKTPFPFWDNTWIWTAICAIDANLPFLISRPPVIQTTPERTALLVYMTFALSVAYYGRFVTLVINDITEYLGIACFTVKKKDEKGEWRDATKEKKHAFRGLLP